MVCLRFDRQRRRLAVHGPPGCTAAGVGTACSLSVALLSVLALVSGGLTPGRHQSEPASASSRSWSSHGPHLPAAVLATAARVSVRPVAPRSASRPGPVAARVALAAAAHRSLAPSCASAPAASPLVDVAQVTSACSGQTPTPSRYTFRPRWSGGITFGCHPRAGCHYGVTNMTTCHVWIHAPKPLVSSVERHEYLHVLQCRRGQPADELVADAGALLLGARWTAYTRHPSPAQYRAASQLLRRRIT